MCAAHLLPKFLSFNLQTGLNLSADIFISETDLNVILQTVFQVIILANFYSQYRLRFLLLNSKRNRLVTTTRLHEYMYSLVCLSITARRHRKRHIDNV